MQLIPDDCLPFACPKNRWRSGDYANCIPARTQRMAAGQMCIPVPSRGALNHCYPQQKCAHALTNSPWTTWEHLHLSMLRQLCPKNGPLTCFSISNSTPSSWPPVVPAYSIRCCWGQWFYCWWLHHCSCHSQNPSGHSPSWETWSRHDCTWASLSCPLHSCSVCGPPPAHSSYSDCTCCSSGLSKSWSVWVQWTVWTRTSSRWIGTKMTLAAGRTTVVCTADCWDFCGANCSSTDSILWTRTAASRERLMGGPCL